MKVTLGASIEQANGQWWKCDVELDETDLVRILVQMDGPDPARLNTGDVFKILEPEAQRLLLADLMIRHPSTRTEENQRQMLEAAAQRDKAVEQVKARVGQPA
jgi:hypothetical protein